MISNHTIAVTAYIINTYNQLSNADDKMEKLTPKRLQKLVYFCDKAYREEYLFSMVKDKFVAWEMNGPVIPDIFFEFCDVNATKVSIKKNCPTLDDSWKNLTIKKTVDQVLNQTKYVSTEQLIQKSKEDCKNYAIKKDNTIEF